MARSRARCRYTAATLAALAILCHIYAPRLHELAEPCLVTWAQAKLGRDATKTMPLAIQLNSFRDTGLIDTVAVDPLHDDSERCRFRRSGKPDQFGEPKDRCRFADVQRPAALPIRSWLVFPLPVFDAERGEILPARGHQGLIGVCHNKAVVRVWLASVDVSVPEAHGTFTIKKPAQPTAHKILAPHRASVSRSSAI